MCRIRNPKDPKNKYFDELTMIEDVSIPLETVHNAVAVSSTVADKARSRRTSRTASIGRGSEDSSQLEEDLTDQLLSYYEDAIQSYAAYVFHRTKSISGR